MCVRLFAPEMRDFFFLVGLWPKFLPHRFRSPLSVLPELVDAAPDLVAVVGGGDGGKKQEQEGQGAHVGDVGKD